MYRFLRIIRGAVPWRSVRPCGRPPREAERRVATAAPAAHPSAHADVPAPVSYAERFDALIAQQIANRNSPPTSNWRRYTTTKTRTKLNREAMDASLKAYRDGTAASCEAAFQLMFQETRPTTKEQAEKTASTLPKHMSGVIPLNYPLILSQACGISGMPDASFALLEDIVTEGHELDSIALVNLLSVALTIRDDLLIDRILKQTQEEEGVLPVRFMLKMCDHRISTGELEEAFCWLRDMIATHGFVSTVVKSHDHHNETLAKILAFVKDSPPNESRAMFDDLVQLLDSTQAVLTQTSSKALAAVATSLGYDVTSTKISWDGKCRACGSSLRSNQLKAQLDDDRQALYSHCLDKLRFEYAEELHKFLEAIMPLPQRTIFIDTLNVGLHPTRRNIPYHYGYLFEVLNYYKTRNVPTFFIGRHHILARAPPKYKALLQKLVDNGKLFLLPNEAPDDLFQLIAVLSRPDGRLLSNDEFRDHRFSFAGDDPKFGLLLRQWSRRCQLNFRLSDGHKILFYPIKPRLYFQQVQAEDGICHSVSACDRWFCMVDDIHG